jgi:hypothetical protein
VHASALQKFDLHQCLSRASDPSFSSCKKIREEESMPIDALLLSLAICFVFALFAVILAWTDHSTTIWQKKQKTAELPSVPSKKAA